jgi:hypothetical protein
MSISDSGRADHLVDAESRNMIRFILFFIILCLVWRIAVISLGDEHNPASDKAKFNACVVQKNNDVFYCITGLRLGPNP